MPEKVLAIGSISTATRAKRALLREGVRSRFVKTDSHGDGCSWGLKIDHDALLTAIKILREAGISYEVL